MYGMNRTTGAALSGSDHLQQSIEDILTTRKGTRVMRRDYGSDLPELLDRPFNAETKVDMIAATADALALWEPRISLTSVSVTLNSDDESKPYIDLELEGTNLDTNTALDLETITIS